jgi:hypothetical protein
VFAAVLVMALFGLEKWRPWRQDMGRDFDGDFSDGLDDRIAEFSIPRHQVPR